MQKSHYKKKKSSVPRFEVNGIVKECLSHGFFIIITEPHNFSVLGHLAGKLRKYSIMVKVGDAVRVELSPYDTARGRIVFRYKSPKIKEI